MSSYFEWQTFKLNYFEWQTFKLNLFWFADVQTRPVWGCWKPRAKYEITRNCVRCCANRQPVQEANGEQATCEQATDEQASGEQATGEQASGEQATGTRGK